MKIIVEDGTVFMKDTNHELNARQKGFQDNGKRGRRKGFEVIDH